MYRAWGYNVRVVLAQGAEWNFFLSNSAAASRLIGLKEVEVKSIFAGLDSESSERFSCFFFITFDHSRLICLKEQHAFGLRDARAVCVRRLGIPGEDLACVRCGKCLPRFVHWNFRLR